MVFVLHQHVRDWFISIIFFLHLRKKNIYEWIGGCPRIKTNGEHY